MDRMFLFEGEPELVLARWMTIGVGVAAMIVTIYAAIQLWA